MSSPTPEESMLCISIDRADPDLAKDLASRHDKNAWGIVGSPKGLVAIAFDNPQEVADFVGAITLDPFAGGDADE